ncbi:MAG: hypothetical protein V3V08_11305 [Nannocystaceae bacterium]
MLPIRTLELSIPRVWRREARENRTACVVYKPKSLNDGPIELIVKPQLKLITHH